MFQVYHKSDIGLKRQSNQDAFRINQDMNLFIIADGMGGHNGGETASQNAVDIIEACFISKNKIKDPEDLIISAMEKANKEIFLQSLEDRDLKGMGTTCSLVFIDDKIHMGHVGDSRVYFIKEDIKQVSVDHTLVERLIAKGEINREEGRNHPRKNMITRAVGTEADIRVDYAVFDRQAADHIIICSDGLTGKVEDQEILSIVKKNPNQVGVDYLVALANERGGEDNISLILVTQDSNKEV